MLRRKESLLHALDYSEFYLLEVWFQLNPKDDRVVGTLEHGTTKEGFASTRDGSTALKYVSLFIDLSSSRGLNWRMSTSISA